MNAVVMNLTERNNMESQNKAILLHLQQGNIISALQAIDLFGCARLAARIKDLKYLGHHIKDVWCRCGKKRFKVYYID